MSIRDDLQHPLDMISEVGKQLDNLSYAFATTGNSVMADKLCIMSTILDDAAININQAMSDELDRAQEASANKATLDDAEAERQRKKLCIIASASAYHKHYPGIIFEFVKNEGSLAIIKFRGNSKRIMAIPKTDIIFVEDNGNNSEEE